MTDLQKEIFTQIIELLRNNHGEYNLYGLMQEKIKLSLPVDGLKLINKDRN